jgi:hypothetical protein
VLRVPATLSKPAAVRGYVEERILRIVAERYRPEPERGVGRGRGGGTGRGMFGAISSVCFSRPAADG